jgi:Cof subfamily protein (haloacid dehalogenase superfamily)
MGKFTGILIVSDVDGTFLSGNIDGLHKNIKAIERFKEQGGLFAFATGRDLLALLEVIPDTEKISNVPVICANGSQIYDFAQAQYIFNCPVADKKLLGEMVRLILNKYPKTGVRFSCKNNCENNMIIPDFNEMLKRDLKGLSLDNLRIIQMPLEELVHSDINIYKTVFVDRDNPENLEDIKKICEDADINNEFYFAKSYWCGLETINKNGTKGQAALQLKEYLENLEYFGGSIKLFAIGDYDNDMEMLKAADFGAAPESALEHIKQAAKIITASCENGAVASLIDIIEREYIS